MLSINCLSQSLDWAKILDGSSPVHSYDMAVDSAGYVFTTGTFRGTSDFDPGPDTIAYTCAGDHDSYIQILDSLGNYEWAGVFTGSNMVMSKTICIDNNNNIYIAGKFKGKVDFNPGAGEQFVTGSSAKHDIFIVKISHDLQFSWIKTINGNDAGDGEPYGIDVDDNGNVYIAGSFKNGSMDFDPGPATESRLPDGTDMFILKLDASGAFLWVYTPGRNKNNDIARDVAVDKDGNVFATGNFGDTIVYNSGLDSITSYFEDMFAIQLDGNTGNIIWAMAAGVSGSSEQGQSITVDANNNYYIAGVFEDSVDFDPSDSVVALEALQRKSIFVTKYNSDHKIQWARILVHGLPYSGYINSATCQDIFVDNHGNVYTAGSFNGRNCDFNPGDDIHYLSTSGFSFDGYIHKMNSSGKMIWVHQIGENQYSSSDDGKAIHATNGEKIYFCGNIAYAADFAPGDDEFLIELDYSNAAFMAKWDKCGIIETQISHTECNHFEFNGNTIYQSGVYFDTILNNHGCDSIIELNLTINNIDTTVTVYKDSLAANAANAVYQWIDCNTGDSVQGATDKYFVPEYNSEYAVIITKNNCTDTSGCYYINTTETLKLIDNQNILLYPNPVKNELCISGTNNNMTSIKIAGTSGYIHDVSKNNSNCFDLSSLSNGLYFIIIKTNKNTITKKMIINKQQ
jgi:hypothetical protein